MSIKVSYTYCEWSDREEVRKKMRQVDNKDKVKLKEEEKEDGK